jgi:pimeloyl-ACP methyl ester carboxylesterase
MIASEVVGGGEPLLMIMGLSLSRRGWARLLPHLEPHAECITFDNRGTGDSSPVRGLLSMTDLVGDALDVLDRAGHESAHVLGVSMGGMIAQHLALEHRRRVRSLVLGCTAPVGRSGLPPWRLLAATALRPLMGPGRTAPLLAPAVYSARTRREHPERLREDLELRLADATSVQTSLAQLLAITGHDTRRRLSELAGLDVTVIHGEDDALVPCRNGRELAEGIPGARLVTIPDCGHMLTTDAEDETAAAVIEHLDRVTRGTTAAEGRS